MSEIKNMAQEENLVSQNQQGWQMLRNLIDGKSYSSVFILVDENTKRYCLPLLLRNTSILKKARILEIMSGEKNKTIDTCVSLWSCLLENRADKNSLLINLGGGMVTDLGGFVAATYKRGMDFINIPTTLLAMVDAAIGGKNGIDFGNAKNQIGTINVPEMVLIESEFLKTLPQNELYSGAAEMYKHGLIYDIGIWERVSAADFTKPINLRDLIWESLQVKLQIVSKDPNEKGLRKTLNFGHTLGHAIEAFLLDNEERKTLLHGEAIAIGMILELFLSQHILGFPEDKMKVICDKIISKFSKQVFTVAEIDKIVGLLIFDKKNRNGKVLFVLLEDIGRPRTDCEAENSLIYKAFSYYKNL